MPGPHPRREGNTAALGAPRTHGTGRAGNGSGPGPSSTTAEGWRMSSFWLFIFFTLIHNCC